jgi:hypothetical protein
MRNMNRVYLFAIAIAGLAAVSIPTQNLQAQKPQKSRPVQVLNTDQNPVPVQGVYKTISVVAGLAPQDEEQTLKSPVCPDGTEFLISALNVSSSIDTDDIWEVRVRLAQKYALGPAAPADLVVVGTGRAHTSLFLHAGQSTLEPGEVTVKFIHSAGPKAGGSKDGIYTAHISGYCGEPYVIQNESVNPSQIGNGPLPIGWDLKSNQKI